jgi:hypothetical protein
LNEFSVSLLYCKFNNGWGRLDIYYIMQHIRNSKNQEVSVGVVAKFQLGWWRSLLARRSHSCLRNPEVESSSLSHLIIFCNYVIHKDFFEWERYDLIKIIIKRLAMMLIMI